MKSIEITEISVRAIPGSHVNDCIKEAIELAAKEWRNVRLKHNDDEYLIRPNNLFATAEKV